MSVATRLAVTLALNAAGCVPLEDLSSYRSAGADVTPAVPPLASPVGADAAVASDAPLAASGASRALDDGAADVAPDAGAALDAGGAPPARLDGLAPDAAMLASTSLPGALIGESRHTLGVSGSERSFIYYAPPTLDPNVPAPALIVAHGFEETASDMVAITGYDAIAEREGFVVLYPEGQGLIPWNIGEGVCQGGARPVSSASGDDSAFVDAMLAFVALDRAIDSEHVFMSGLSSGGYLASDLACRRRDIRAVVAHSGGSHALDACLGANKPVLLLHGANDAAVPATCSAEARDRWAEHNGCAGDAIAFDVLGGACELSPCPADGQVARCTFEGMGRGWAGGSAQAASFLDFESASELSWLFFETFAW